MSVDLLIVLLIAALVAIIAAGITGWVTLRRQKSRVAKLYDEMIEAYNDTGSHDSLMAVHRVRGFYWHGNKPLNYWPGRPASEIPGKKPQNKPE